MIENEYREIFGREAQRQCLINFFPNRDLGEIKAPLHQTRERYTEGTETNLKNLKKFPAQTESFGIGLKKGEK